MSEKKYTPMIQQYLDVKKNHQDTILFYRLGDFYEMFFDDALIASKELDLVLTGRNGGVEEKIPMCGIPYHAAQNYLPKLVSRGYKVAIVEQLEDASTTKGIVRRDVIKIVTPGTMMDDIKDEKTSQYLAAIYENGIQRSVMFCDMSTGEIRCYQVGNSLIELRKQLLINQTKEVVIDKKSSTMLRTMLKELQDILISEDEGTELLPQYLPLLTSLYSKEVELNLALLVNYLRATQKCEQSHLLPVEFYNEEAYVKMDYATRTNLELVNPIRANAKTPTLFSFLDQCLSAMGSRKLKSWIEYPLIDESKINERLEIIEYINEHFLRKAELKAGLKEVYDVERLSARIAYGSINPKELQRLRRTLQFAPQIVSIFNEDEKHKELSEVDVCKDVYELLESALTIDPPYHVKDGNVFLKGYNAELDECRALGEESEAWIIQMESSLRELTGIKSLKIGYNRIFGYYVEVSKLNSSLIKEEYGFIRKQTLTNAERYVTQEIKQKEEQILHSQERIVRLEIELFEDLVTQLKGALSRIHQLSKVLSEIDAYYALAEISSQKGYQRPKFNTENKVELKDGRHPILEKTMKDSFVANDCCFNEETSILLLTGPNMGGKSTYMRTNALLVIMAQMGCYIPVREANLMIFTQIFTRIGASDDIMGGKSTFMVEMDEANHALQKANCTSLVLFDEIGRGTSTYDGMALAGAMIEYLEQVTKAKTIFSTHYHELTALENHTSICNVHVEVVEKNEHVTFLYKVKEGKADKSYGINVAKLAKLPSMVLTRASQILQQLEQETTPYQPHHVEYVQTSNVNEWLIEDLKALDCNQITPFEALQYLMNSKEKLK